MSITKSQNARVMSEEAIQYLCKCINLVNSLPTSVIDNLHLADNLTFSSTKIDSLLTILKEDCNKYTDSIVANLSRLELRVVTDEADMIEHNKLYLIKKSGETSYSQYVIVTNDSGVDEKILLGTCDISMTDYLKITDAESTYCKITDFNTLTTEVTKVKNTLGTEDISAISTTVTGAINELNTNKIGKSDINTTIDSTSTDDTIPSSKSVYDYIGTLNSLTGDIEYGNFKLIDNYTITSATETPVKELIPFKSLLNSEGNMTSNNGLVPLKKGKTYKITSAIRTNDVSSTDNGYLEFCLYDNKGNLLKQGIANNGIIIRGNYPINYTITPKEDISVGIYITYHTSQVTVIVGENRSYLNITEIPNPTSIMNVTDNHIKEVANTYSTNETVIGKWIDGKPIYRKVITTNSTQIDVSSFNIENVSDVRYFVKTTGNYIFPGAYGYASNNMIALYFINGYSQMSIGFARPDNFSSATIILEYTKTTD